MQRTPPWCNCMLWHGRGYNFLKTWDLFLWQYQGLKLTLPLSGVIKKYGYFWIHILLLAFCSLNILHATGSSCTKNWFPSDISEYSISIFRWGNHYKLRKWLFSTEKLSELTLQWNKYCTLKFMNWNIANIQNYQVQKDLVSLWLHV